MIPRWTVLRVEVPTALEDEVAQALGEASLGAELAPSRPGRTLVSVYFSGVAGDAAALARAGAVLERLGLDSEASAPSVSPLDDGRWVERYQESLRPLPIGRRFVVVPGDDRALPPHRVPIRIVPGMAFGTGEHPTTQLCGAALERRVAPGSRWLDIGTGSGVLAILAGLCGAAEVFGVDVDPAAVAVARENVGVNGVGSSLVIEEGSIERRGSRVFDGIVANIALTFFLSRAVDLASALRPGGVLIASGFVEDDLAEIEAALTGAGFRVTARAKEPPWASLEAETASAS